MGKNKNDKKKPTVKKTAFQSIGSTNSVDMKPDIAKKEEDIKMKSKSR